MTSLPPLEAKKQLVMKSSERDATFKRLYVKKEKKEDEPDEQPKRIPGKQLDSMLERLTQLPRRTGTINLDRFAQEQREKKDLLAYDPEADTNLSVFWARKEHLDQAYGLQKSQRSKSPKPPSTKRDRQQKSYNRVEKMPQSDDCTQEDRQTSSKPQEEGEETKEESNANEEPNRETEQQPNEEENQQPEQEKPSKKPAGKKSHLGVIPSPYSTDRASPYALGLRAAEEKKQKQKAAYNQKRKENETTKQEDDKEEKQQPAAKQPPKKKTPAPPPKKEEQASESKPQSRRSSPAAKKKPAPPPKQSNSKPATSENKKKPAAKPAGKQAPKKAAPSASSSAATTPRSTTRRSPTPKDETDPAADSTTARDEYDDDDYEKMSNDSGDRDATETPSKAVAKEKEENKEAKSEESSPDSNHDQSPQSRSSSSSASSRRSSSGFSDSQSPQKQDDNPPREASENPEPTETQPTTETEQPEERNEEAAATTKENEQEEADAEEPSQVEETPTETEGDKNESERVETTTDQQSTDVHEDPKEETNNAEPTTTKEQKPDEEEPSSHEEEQKQEPKDEKPDAEAESSRASSSSSASTESTTPSGTTEEEEGTEKQHVEETKNNDDAKEGDAEDADGDDYGDDSFEASSPTAGAKPNAEESTDEPVKQRRDPQEGYLMLQILRAQNLYFPERKDRTGDSEEDLCGDERLAVKAFNQRGRTLLETSLSKKLANPTWTTCSGWLKNDSTTSISFCYERYQIEDNDVSKVAGEARYGLAVLDLSELLEGCSTNGTWNEKTINFQCPLERPELGDVGDLGSVTIRTMLVFRFDKDEGDAVPPIEHQYGALCVSRGEGFPDMDWFGKSDWFCWGFLSSDTETRRLQTNIENNTQEPRWDRERSLCVIPMREIADNKATFRLEVYDDDVGDDYEMLGVTDLTESDFRRRGGWGSSIELKMRPQDADAKSASLEKLGSLTVETYLFAPEV